MYVTWDWPFWVACSVNKKRDPLTTWHFDLVALMNSIILVSPLMNMAMEQAYLFFSRVGHFVSLLCGGPSSHVGLLQRIVNGSANGPRESAAKLDLKAFRTPY